LKLIFMLTDWRFGNGSSKWGGDKVASVQGVVGAE